MGGGHNDDSTIEPTLAVENFALTISERPSKNVTLGKINTTPNLDNLNFTLTNQSAKNSLGIDSSTGELFVNDE